MEDDIYYSAHDTAAAENYSNYTGVGERRTQGRKDNAEEQTQHVKDRKNHTDSDRINRSIVSTLGYIMLDALYLFLIFE